jgi:hypothetical protein
MRADEAVCAGDEDDFGPECHRPYYKAWRGIWVRGKGPRGINNEGPLQKRIENILYSYIRYALSRCEPIKPSAP